MFRTIIIVLTVFIYSATYAERGWGQYRLYGKAYKSIGVILSNAELKFITGKDTSIIKTESLGNFETKVTWRTFDRTNMRPGVDINIENEKMNPPIIAIWNNKSVSIPVKWQEAQNAQYNNNWKDKPYDLTF